MKIVVNKCYGGFSLSAKAVARIAELNGAPCFFFKNLSFDKLVPATVDEIDKDCHFSAYTVATLPESKSSQWHSMTQEERIEENKKWGAITLPTRPENRTDPKLIQAVEELGDAANGACAKLRVIEIPDDIDCIIEEYGGIEHVAEAHRTW